MRVIFQFYMYISDMNLYVFLLEYHVSDIVHVLEKVFLHSSIVPTPAGQSTGHDVSQMHSIPECQIRRHL